MVFVPLEGNLTPEEQHAKMLERLNEMESGPKQQKPGEGRKTNNATIPSAQTAYTVVLLEVRRGGRIVRTSGDTRGSGSQTSAERLSRSR